MNEIIDVNLQFSYFFQFHLSQYVSHLEPNERREKFKVMVTKGMGIIAGCMIILPRWLFIVSLFPFDYMT